jgi:hypothetical protein
VGHDEHERGRALDGLGEVGDGHDIVAQVVVGEVLDVLVGRVDDVGELLAVNLALVCVRRVIGGAVCVLGRDANGVTAATIAAPANKQLTISSNTQTGTRSSNASECLRTFWPAIKAIVEPLGSAMPWGSLEPSSPGSLGSAITPPHHQVARWLSWLARARTHQLPEPIMQTLSRVMLVEMCRERVASLGAAARDM